MTISRPICPFCGEIIKNATGACSQCGMGAKEVLYANIAAIEAEFSAAKPTPQVREKTSRFLGRKSVTMILAIVGIIAFLGGVIFNAQREARWAELRESDPAAYLTELHGTDEDRWVAELRELDAETHAAEAARRAAIAEAEHFAKCSDQKTSLAYVMIQEDVRRSLRAPSTAEFPGRYGAGTRNMGNCVYQVFGQFNAQNGFGAMIRGTFTGTTEYFPKSGSWRTLTLDVQG